jgi:exodeoxyribonuclease V alpha subunit
MYCVYDGNVMFRWLYEKELHVAKHVIDHVLAYESVETHLNLCVDDYMCRFELENSMTLNKKQRAAVTTVFTSRSGIALLTGLPGTGKTSVIKCIEYIASHECILYEMASPTGKSASKMGKSAKTMHRLLESVYDGRVFEFQRTERNPIAADLIILDEVSMLDIELFYDFIKSCRPACMIVLIGDNNQLPSVKCGDVLGSLIRSGCIPHVHLSKLYRQGVGSHIPFVAKKVKDGEYLSSSDLNNDSVNFIPCVDESALKQHVLDFYRMNKSSCNSKILAPNNSVVDLLNDDIHLYEYDTSSPMFEIGEAVMCVSNEYGKCSDGSVDAETTVLNGEFVTVCSYKSDVDFVEIQKHDGLKSKITVSSKSLKYGYCITIHKSQGDEYDKVLLVLYNSPSKLLNKKLLYTALTRAKSHITIIGTMKYLRQCIDCPLDRCDVLESLILHEFENNERLSK